MLAAIGRYALTAGLLRRYQFTPAPRDFFSVMTHDSRMPTTAYSLKMGFTQRSPHIGIDYTLINDVQATGTKRLRQIR